MGEFIEIRLDFSRCTGIESCGACTTVCPVNIFGRQDDRPLIVAENEDECTLCDLCRQACDPSAISIHKSYADD